jgi:hypothetical protein
LNEVPTVSGGDEPYHLVFESAWPGKVGVVPIGDRAPAAAPIDEDGAAPPSTLR